MGKRELAALSAVALADRDRKSQGRGDRVRRNGSGARWKPPSESRSTRRCSSLPPPTSNIRRISDSSSDDTNSNTDDGDDDDNNGDNNNEENNNIQNHNQNQILPPFVSPPPPKGNGKKSFRAIDPINSLLPLDQLKDTFEDFMACPRVTCVSRLPDHALYGENTLETTAHQYGFATALNIKCSCCGWSHTIKPSQKVQLEGEEEEENNNKKKEDWEYDSKLFHKFEINHGMGMCMQKLGKGFTHMAMMMAFLGLSNSIGSTEKWSTMVDRIGLSEWTIAEQAMEENRKKELDLVIAKADEEIATWLQTQQGMAADEATITAKRDAILHKRDGRIGIIMSGDEGWTKRKIGKNGGDSLTGQNYGLGVLSSLIMSTQSTSMCCRMCDNAAKLGRPVRFHRCPKNFDRNKSSKSMEGYSNVQHCEDVFNSKHGIYVCGFVTDDDSTTWANLQHSYNEIIAVEYGRDVLDPEGNVLPNKKRDCGWPTIMPNDAVPAANVGKHLKIYKKNKDGTYSTVPVLPDFKNDRGLMPLHAPSPFINLRDHLHRARSLGTRLYAFKVGTAKDKTKSDMPVGLNGAECENMKRNFQYFLALNQHYCDERFETEGECTVLHQWNDHYKCDPSWCTYLQAEVEENPKKKRKIDNQKKYRSKDTPEGMKLFNRVHGSVVDLIMGPKMKQVHHGHNAQKNETLNSQLIAKCPKDTHCGGSMQFHDRVRLLVVEDSLGEYEGLGRLYHALGLSNLNKALGIWANTKDIADKKTYEHRSQPEHKKRRAADKLAKMKANIRKDVRAAKEGVTYGQGIANERQMASADTAGAATNSKTTGKRKRKRSSSSTKKSSTKKSKH